MTTPRKPMGMSRKPKELDFSPVVIDGREYHHVTFYDEPYQHMVRDKVTGKMVPSKFGMCVKAVCQCGDKDPKTGRTNLYREFPESLNNGGLAGAKAAVRRKAFEHLEEEREKAGG